jgi:hypothetical protein
MLVCPECRGQLAQDADRCPRCGADVQVAPVLVGEASRPPGLGGRSAQSLPRRAVWARWGRWLAGVGIAAWIGVAVAGSFAGSSKGPTSSQQPRILSTGSSPGLSVAAAPGSLGVAPVRTGDFWRCPYDTPLRAYAEGRHYYQPNHPLLPALDRRPERCFRDPGDAERAGYSQALLPQDSFEEEGLFLVPVDLYAQCLRASRSLGFTVPCPTHLPNAGPGASGPSCSAPTPMGELRPPCVYLVTDCGTGTCREHRAFLLDYSGYAVPPALQSGPGSPPAYIVVAAYRTEELNQGSLPELSCPEATEEGTTDLLFGRAPARAIFLSCPDTPGFQGAPTTMLRWTAGDVTYQVAISGGRTGGNLNLLLTLASRLDFVPISPDSTQQP